MYGPIIYPCGLLNIMVSKAPGNAPRLAYSAANLVSAFKAT